MNDFNLIDLFFLITGIAVIFLTALAALLLINLILFFRSLRLLSHQASKAAKVVTEDLKEFSTKVKHDGLSLRSILTFLFGFGKHKPTPTKKSK